VRPGVVAGTPAVGGGGFLGVAAGGIAKGGADLDSAAVGVGTGIGVAVGAPGAAGRAEAAWPRRQQEPPACGRCPPSPDCATPRFWRDQCP
jgi:hypothetical protein